MGKTVPVNLPDEVYEHLEGQARDTGRPLEDLVAEWLASFPPIPELPTGEAAEEAWKRFTRHFGTFHSGDPRSADNERIDADLAHEYGNEHPDDR